ncbi:MAG: HlyD family efflux transporter periplasmic adaptor subunit [Bacteroidales bacterium]|nr:HlyD family efflux transporter periplasmic adaptor subunit [Bacteroidales bacterium]
MKINKEETGKIELRSNEVQEILNRPPKWIVRWGITIVFLVVMVIVTGSWFFRYPDIVTADITLTTKNPPAPILAKTTGKIQNLFVSDNELVSKKQVLGVIENPGSYESIVSLMENLEKFKSNFKLGEIINISNKTYLLGEIQSYYATFNKNTEDYNKTIKLNYHRRKIELYVKELKKYDLYLANLQVQNGILKEEYQLTKKQCDRDSVLYEKELLSEADFEKSKSELLSESYNFEQNNVLITNVEIQIENLNQSILELELQHEKQISDQVIRISESYENLLSVIDSWKHKFVLIAPTNGIVTFNQFWNENQSVKSGEIVLIVIPKDEGEMIGKVQLTFQGAGKVKEGQLANIQFANYPYMEFGMVKGIIRSISLAPSNNFYTAEIELPDGLKTFYNVELDFKQEMKGTAEIITEDIRLLERIIRPFRYVLNKNTKIGTLKKD